MDKSVATLSTWLSKPLVRRTAYVAAGGVAALCVLAWLGVPSVLRWGLETKAAAFLGRKVSADGITFNPVSLTAKIDNLRVASADGNSSLLAVTHLKVSLSWQSLWYRGPVVDALQLDQPAIHFSRTGPDQYSFNDIILRLTAPDPKAKPGDPLRFSLNNIELHDGRVEFDDKPVGKVHRIEGIQIGVPFISNFPARVQLAVVPHLDAVVNGSALRLDGQLKPFLNNNDASLDIALAPFDLTQYLGYAPTRLPFVLKNGVLDSTLRLVWGHGPKGGQHFVLSGHLGVSKLDIRDASDAALLGFEKLGLDITRLEPLAVPVRASISKVRLEAPALRVTRNEAGEFNFAKLLSANEETATAPSPKPEIAIDVVELESGRLSWRDSTVKAPYELTLQPFGLRVQRLDLATDKAAEIEVSARGDGGQEVAFSGHLNPFRGEYDGHLHIDGVQIAALRPYYATQVGAATLQGIFSADAELKIATHDEVQFALSQTKGGLREFGVLIPGARKPLVDIAELLVDGLTLDLNKRMLQVEKISSTRAKWSLIKGAGGEIDLLSALKPLTKAPSEEPPVRETPQATADWQLSLGEVALTAWSLHFEDRSGSTPVSLNMLDLGLRLSEWNNSPGHRASFSLASNVNKKGRLSLSGKFATDPLEANLKADLRDVDLLAVQPYVDQHFKVLVTRGSLTGKGKIDLSMAKPAQPDLKFQGDVAINEFSSLDRINDTDFVQWRHLGLTGLAVDSSPLSIAAKELRLEDFYSRLILDAQGRFNLRELAAEGGDDDVPAPVATAPVAASSAPSAPLPSIRLDKLVLTGGAVNYSDRFVKPNYDAKLAAVNGTMSDLSSDPKTVAQLDLKAALDGSAPVVVSGQLNPLRQDQFLDIHAQVSGIDLTSVSTYAAKYVGYGITKGKLSMDLKYQIRDRKLSAENQLNLDQLTFGERVESPDATKLPVLFAVSLLKNRKGEIDINLPIGGSLDDPTFSVGGIVVKVIINVITKAITAPFALIGSLFGGGGEELSYLEFLPGKTALTPAAIVKLQSISKALLDRPALRLDVTGHADPASDLDGVNRGRLNERLRATKAELLVKQGESVADLDGLIIEPTEYPKLIERVYGAEKVANKPRNALGLAKAIPVEEMERLLLSHFAKDAPDLDSLASERAKAVRDWLISEGKVEAERIFLVGEDRSGAEKGATANSPRVSFALK